jgi:carbamoyl-phosphate synthase large subunit
MLYPTVDLSQDCLDKIRSYACRLARIFHIRGLFNLQLAVYKGQPFVLELNARASRTIPFLSKATGVPWAKVATRVLLGESLASALRRYPARRDRGFYYAKSSAFCFYRFPGPPPPLGPEMRSTGETMGVAKTPEEALAKARLSAGQEPLAKFTRHYCLQEL